jgi:hypothetical protein
MIKTCHHCGKPMQSQRNTKKYCSDNCKQLAFYKRSGLALSGINDNDNFLVTDKQHAKEPFISNETITELTHEEKFKEPIMENLPARTLSDKLTVTVTDPLTIKPAQEEMPYECVRSKIVDSIADYIDNSEALFMFQCPEKYWGAHVLPTVKWVSLRLRCLMESLIKLSHISAIDYASMVAVRGAFTTLINSSQFRRLPTNYPYTALIKDLEQKLTFIAKQYKHSESIQFRLTQKRKVELIGNRYILADFVPAIKFSEMDFKE